MDLGYNEGRSRGRESFFWELLSHRSTGGKTSGILSINEEDSDTGGKKNNTVVKGIKVENWVANISMNS